MQPAKAMPGRRSCEKDHGAALNLAAVERRQRRGRFVQREALCNQTIHRQPARAEEFNQHGQIHLRPGLTKEGAKQPLVLVDERARVDCGGCAHTVQPPARDDTGSASHTRAFEKNLMFFMGLGILVLVPAFKTWTGLPPFMGILFGLGLLWAVGDVVHRRKDDDAKAPLTLVHALSRIDMGSIVFFIGILLAVATLEHTHVLGALAQWLTENVGRLDVMVLIIVV